MPVDQTPTNHEGAGPRISPVVQTLRGHVLLWIACVAILYATYLLASLTGAVSSLTLTIAIAIGYVVSIKADGPERRTRIVANLLVALVTGVLLVGALVTIEIEGEGLFVASLPGFPRELPSVVMIGADAWIMALGVQCFMGVVNGIYAFHLGQQQRAQRELSGLDACIACGSTQVEAREQHLVVCSACGYEARVDAGSMPSAEELAALRAPDER